MGMRTVLALALLLVVGLASPALANDPPGPQMILAEVLILPLMMFLSLLGGAYVILKSRPPKTRMAFRPPRVFIAATLTILAILFSFTNEGWAILLAPFFGIIALERGLRMIGWGLRLLSTKIPPEHLANANRWRLIPAGVLLVVVTLFLMAMPLVFFGYGSRSHSRNRDIEGAVRTFVAYQLAYGNLEKSRTGNVQFHRLRLDDEFLRHFSWAGADVRFLLPVRVEYGADEKNFTIYGLPYGFPPFPYNYLASQPCYRGDETGQIRMIYVYNRDERCPANAPVVLRVGDQDLQKMTQDTYDNREVRKAAIFLLSKLNDSRPEAR